MKFTRLYFILFLVLVLSGTAGFAQNVRFNAISLANGLSQSTVTCFEQDNDGFIWVGTRDGLNRYDGYNFATLKHQIGDSSSISGNVITAILQDSKDNIWVGTTFGLNKLDGKTLESKGYYRLIEDSSSLSSNGIRCIAEDASGQLWVGTDHGLNRMIDTDGGFQRYSIIADDTTSLANNIVNDIFIDKYDHLWVATDGGLNKYNQEEDNFSRLRSDFSDGRSVANNVITDIENGPGDTLWLGTQDGLNWVNIANFDISRSKPRARGLNLSGVVINTLLYDEKGDLWIGTPLGLNRVNGKNLRKLRVYKSSPNDFYTLPNDFVLSLHQDLSGMMWVGTQSAGIATLNEEMPKFSAISSVGTPGYDPLQNQIFDMCQIKKDQIWVGTGKGLAVYKHSNRRIKFLSNDKKNRLREIQNPVRSIKYVGDTIVWIGTDGGGLYSYHKKSEKLESYRTDAEGSFVIPSNRINQILPDKTGNLWLATSGHGVIFLDLANNQVRSFAVDLDDPSSLRDNNVNVLALQSDSILWIGTGNAGLYALNINSEKFTSYISGPIKTGNLPTKGINDLFVDQNDKLWVASSGGGLSYFDVERNKFYTYDNSHGLASNEVLSILSDDYGNLWMSTNRGISVFSLSGAKFRNFSEQDVLTKNTFYPRSSHRDRNGMLYFGGANGFGFFNALGLKANNFIPPIVITGTQSLNESTLNSPLDLAQSRHDTLNLEHDHSGFTLEFASLNFKQSGKNQYAYRLKGLFEKWKYTGTRRFATFLNLEPGNYVFEVIGSNNDGVWNEVPAKIVIIVRPALWQELWFQGILAIGFITLLFLFYRYKISSEQQRNKELEQAVEVRTKEIAQERDNNAILLREVHHRVKNNLQIIVSLLNLQKRFIENKKFGDVFSEVQDRVRSMSLIHQKMYQTADLQSVDIEEYITDLSNNLLSTYSLEQEIVLDVDVEVNRFKSDTLTPLGLLLNEVITNALKYAFKNNEKGRVFVNLFKLDKPRKYRLIIGDDGVGISPEQLADPTDSFGTELIGALVEQLNGTIVLLEEEPGTVYQIDFEEEED